MITSNDEMLSPRELRRALSPNLDRLSKREIEKLVLMQGNEMRYVILRVEDYERLTAEDE